VRALTIVAIAAAAAVGAAILAMLYLYPATQVTSSGNDSNSNGAPVVREGGLEGYNQTVVGIGDVRLLADIADTPEKKSLGLGVRESMDEGEAMLFVFESPGSQGFWMNGMKFPIDIIWIGEDKKVVHIEHSLQPCPTVLDCPTYTPDGNAMYVLETVTGFAEKRDVTDGTQVEFELS
jgi:uncharacterized membrane protein (UPF0127 family)